MALCDAKKLLSQIRGEFQARKLLTSLSEADVVEAMANVPEEVVKVLKLLKSHTSAKTVAPKPKAAVATETKPLIAAVPEKAKTGGTGG